MTRYADPRRCPDCLGQITYGAESCPTCGLALRGDTAQRLFATLSTADQMLAELRAESDAEPVPAEPGRLVDVAPLPVPTPAPRVNKTWLSAASVPRILLTLGAGCLLVAALVFLAVTWSVMGVTGRTATLVGFTAVAGVLTSWMARRGLRGAAEALCLVGLGLLTLDMFGARHAGWLGDISDAGFLLLLGAVLAVVGVAAALAVRRSTIAALTGAEVVSAIGLALISTGVASGDWFARSAALVVAVLVTAAATFLAHRIRLEFGTVGAAIVTGTTWLVLTADSLERAIDHNTLRGLWLDLQAWPTLVAAAMVAALAVSRRLPVPARVGALSAAQLLVATLVALPADGSTTRATLAVVAVVAAVSALSLVSRSPWGLVGALSLGAGAWWLVGVTVDLGAHAVLDLVKTAGEAWDGSPGGRLVLDLPKAGLASWLLPVALVALAGIGVVLARASTDIATLVRPIANPVVWVGLLPAAGVATLALYPVPVWVVVLASLASAAGFLARWLARPSAAFVLTSAGYLGIGILVSAYDEWLTGFALLVAVTVSAVVHLRAAHTTVSVVGGSALAVVVAGAVWTWGTIGGVDVPWLALTVLVVLAVVTLGAPNLPDSWWANGAASLSRTGTEVGAAAVAIPVALAGLVVAAPASMDTWAAVYLTVVGATASTMSLLRGDRRQLGWVGGALLAAGSWVRLWDVGVHAPEAYTLPSAVALIAVGLVHLRRVRGASTMTALAPGLSLALVPSLLWVFYEPASARSLFLGVGCLALLVVGLAFGWAAPIVFASSVGALVVLRLAAPFVDAAVPRWVLIGAAGALLIAMGATWERRLKDARDLMGYVRAMS
jgi:hypothetical protein